MLFTIYWLALWMVCTCWHECLQRAKLPFPTIIGSMYETAVACTTLYASVTHRLRSFDLVEIYGPEHDTKLLTVTWQLVPVCVHICLSEMLRPTRQQHNSCIFMNSEWSITETHVYRDNTIFTYCIILNCAPTSWGHSNNFKKCCKKFSGTLCGKLCPPLTVQNMPVPLSHWKLASPPFNRQHLSCNDCR